MKGREGKKKRKGGREGERKKKEEKLSLQLYSSLQSRIKDPKTKFF